MNNFASNDDQHKSKVRTLRTTRRYLWIIILIFVVFVLVHSIFSANSNLSPEKSNNKLDQNFTPANVDNMQPNLGVELPKKEEPKLPETPKITENRKDIYDMLDKQTHSSQTASSLVYTSLDEKNNNIERDNNQDRQDNANLNFGLQAANAKVVSVEAVKQKDMKYKILQGKFIPAILETAIDSDLPGMVKAILNTNTYGETGEIILLPRGTRIIGQYNSNISIGQVRVYVIWTRAITPSGIDIALGSPSVDAIGVSGASGYVDSHYWKIFGNSLLLSILGAGSSQYSLNQARDSTQSMYQMAVTQGLLNTSGSMLQANIDIKPTIHISQGSLINVFTARDLDFSKVFNIKS